MWGGFQALPGRSRGLQGPPGEAEISCGRARLDWATHHGGGGGGGGGPGWGVKSNMEHEIQARAM